MKKLLILLFAFSLVSHSFSQNVITAVVNNGRWNQNATWDLNRQPMGGDTVLIPSNINLIVNTNISLTSSNISLEIYGSLDMKVGKLDLGNESSVNIKTGGRITSENGNQTSSEFIRIGGVNKFLGSELGISGPASANKNTGVSPNGFSLSGSVVLPVKFLGFGLALKGPDVLIQWSTSEENHAKDYIVERSAEGSNWIAVATISAAGNSNTVQNYAYTDKNINTRTVYYRIKQTDLDGRSTFTPVRSIRTDIKEMEVKVAAINNKLVLQFPEQAKGNVELRLVSMTGQVISSQTLNRPFGQVVINHLNVKGNTIVSLTDNNSMVVAKQVIF